MDKLTKRQQQILNLIRDSIADTGMPPTRAEICTILGFKSPNAAEDHLKALARKGAIELMQGTSRGIRLLVPDGLPVVGRVAAGHPILAEENVEKHFKLQTNLFDQSADYLLRVKGMSMRDAGILDEDLLAIHRTTDVSNGQIVVARVEDEVTVKRYERCAGKVKLHPENPEFNVIEVDPKRQLFTIEGVVVGVIRNRNL